MLISFKLTNIVELIGAIVVSYVLAILYEGLKTFREWLIFREVKRSSASNETIQNSLNASDRSPLVEAAMNDKQNK